MTFTPAQIQQAMRQAGFTRPPSPTDIANASKYGLGIFRASAEKMKGGAGASDPTTTSPQGPDQMIQAFIDQMKSTFTPQGRPSVTPFEQSGFYNEGDVRGAANAEYDPWAAKQRGYQQTQTAEEERQRQIQEGQSDHDRLESVNQAGGTRSSAYQREVGDRSALRSSDATLRQQAMQRYLEDQQNQLGANKESFVTNRRNEAYQRYLQSIGALTA